MAEIKWTPEQEHAITCLDKDILVSAAAGSGKTAVLIERLLRRIKEHRMYLPGGSLYTHRNDGNPAGVIGKNGEDVWCSGSSIDSSW